MPQKFSIFLGALAMVLIPQLVFAADEPAARALLDKMTSNNSAGFQGGQSKTSITLKLANGKEKTWTTLARVSRKDFKTRTRVTFLEPAESVGTELLMIEQGKSQVTQWLWLPKTARLRRIGGAQKNQAFMDTDFSFGDLSSGGLRVGEARKAGAEAIAGNACTKIEIISKDPEDLYAKMELWLDDKLTVPRQIKFYTADAKLAKTLLVDQIIDVEGKPTLKKFRMLGHVRGSMTTVETRDIDTKVSMPDALFEPENLGK